MTRKFSSRDDAGRQLAARLKDQMRDQILSSSPEEKILVYAIPQGGVPVAKAIAEALAADLDIAPSVQSPIVDSLENTSEDSANFSSVVADRKSGDFLDPKGHLVILVDDVIRAGRTQQTAIRILRERGAKNIIVAAVITTDEARQILREEDCELVVLSSKDADASKAESDFFEEELTVSAQDIYEIRERARRFPSGAQATSTAGPKKVDVNFEGENLRAGLSIPVEAQGVVLFAYEDEESRNNMVSLAGSLNELKLATLILKSARKEDSVRSLKKAVQWLSENHETELLPVGIVANGASAAAALEAATASPEKLRCLVLIEANLAGAENILPHVHAPTLSVMLRTNEAAVTAARGALDTMTSEKVMVLAEEADFEEELVRTTTSWLERYLLPIRPSRGATAATVATVE